MTAARPAARDSDGLRSGLRARLPALIALVAAAWVAVLLATPLWRQAPSPRLQLAGSVMQLGTSVLCHQQADRSFIVAGLPLPVCARCLGLYVGGALGLAAWAWRRPRAGATLRWSLQCAMALTAAPTVLSVGVVWLGGPDTSNDARLIMGVALGSATGVTLAAAAAGDLDAEAVE